MCRCLAGLRRIRPAQVNREEYTNGHFVLFFYKVQISFFTKGDLRECQTSKGVNANVGVGAGRGAWGVRARLLIRMPHKDHGLYSPRGFRTSYSPFLQGSSSGCPHSILHPFIQVSVQMSLCPFIREAFPITLYKRVTALPVPVSSTVFTP